MIFIITIPYSKNFIINNYGTIKSINNDSLIYIKNDIVHLIEKDKTFNIPYNILYVYSYYGMTSLEIYEYNIVICMVNIISNKILDIDGEIFKRIPNFSSYYINKYGLIYSKKSDCFIKHKLDHMTYGYHQVQLVRDDKIKKYMKIHRLVFSTWYDTEINENDVINHKDLNKGNNYYKNLEKTNALGNTRHANINGARNDVWNIDTVYDVCSLLNNNVSPKDILSILNIPAEKYSSLVSLCYRIKIGQSYKDISIKFPNINKYGNKKKTELNEDIINSICLDMSNHNINDFINLKEYYEYFAEKYKVSINIISSLKNKSRWKNISSKYIYK